MDRLSNSQMMTDTELDTDSSDERWHFALRKLGPAPVVHIFRELVNVLTSEAAYLCFLR